MVNLPQGDGAESPRLQPEPPAPDQMLTRKERAEQYRTRLKDMQAGGNVSLVGFLLSKRDHYDQYQSEARKKRNADIQTVIGYYDGDMYRKMQVDGQWSAPTKNPGDFAYSIPIIMGHVDEVLGQAVATQEEYTCEPINTTDQRSRQLAGMLEQLANDDVRRMFTAEKRQREMLRRILGGESERHIYWDVDDQNPLVVNVGEYEDQEAIIPGKRKCLTCDAVFEQTAAMCPGCKGEGPFEDLPDTMGTESVFKEKPVRLSENQLHVPHPLAVQRDMAAATIADSTFVVERDVLPRAIAEYKYQAILDGSTSSPGLTREGDQRRVMETASQQTSATVGDATMTNYLPTSQVDIQRWRIWMDVAEYGWFYLDKEYVLPSGDVLKADTFMDEHRPNGAFVCIIGDQVLEFEKSNKNKKWQVVKYKVRPGTGVGGGYQIIVPLSDVMNDIFNLIYAIGMQMGHPTRVMIRKYMPKAGMAGQDVFVERLPEGMTLDQVFKIFPGAGENGGLSQVFEKIEQMIQFILGTNTINQAGAPDAQAAGTATGVNAMVEQATRRMIPANDLKAEADIETRFLCVENRKIYSTAAQRKLLEDRFGKDTTKFFFEAPSLRALVSFRQKKTTNLPRSVTREASNIETIAKVAAELGKAGVENAPEILERMCDALGVDIAVAQGAIDRRDAERRLNRARDLDKELTAKALGAGSAPNPDEIAAVIVQTIEEEYGELFVMPLMQVQPAYLDVYKDFLYSDEGDGASKSLKMAVTAMWLKHVLGQLQETAIKTELQAQAEAMLTPEQPPDTSGQDAANLAEQEAGARQQEMAAKAEMDQAGKQQDRQAAVEDQAIARQSELEDKAIEEQAKDRDLERKLTEMGASHAMTLEQQEHAAKVAPKPTNGKK